VKKTVYYYVLCFFFGLLCINSYAIETNLQDAICVLKILSGESIDRNISDINGDNKTGIEEAIYSLQIAAGTLPDISFQSLLMEMINRKDFTQYPLPKYTAAAFSSSYDRNSETPDSDNKFFSNLDFCQYLGQETIEGRKELVLFDSEGPGAVVRIWITAHLYKGTIRVYLNSSDKAVIEGTPDQLIGGKQLVDSPLSAERSLGRNLYLPIPYANRCKITYEGPDCFDTEIQEDILYYQINYRTYPENTNVRSFSKSDLTNYNSEINSVQEHLNNPDNSVPSPDRIIKETSKFVLNPTDIFEQAITGGGAISTLQVRLESASDFEQALRSTILAIEFDGKEKVWCPIGDFFGSGPGVSPYETWWQEVAVGDNTITMTARWCMPFKNTSTIRFINLGSQQVTLTLKNIKVIDYKWDDSSMYFNSAWHSERNIPTKGWGDWNNLAINYVTINGKGIYMGDTLTVYNRSNQWWGEGDSKIWVDGESFPSFFGTGTEDYYGYAFCGDGGKYSAPFHAQPRGDGDSGNIGYTTNTRTRSLDAIPFSESLKVDMEIWHWKENTEVDYAVTTYWYATEGATSNRTTEVEEAKAPLVQ